MSVHSISPQPMLYNEKWGWRCSGSLRIVFQRENLKIAQQYFQLVGGSASECDTIPGRQCMASCFFLLKQFDDVLLYLNSIKSYFYNDDTFNFNYAQVTLNPLKCVCKLNMVLLWLVYEYGMPTNFKLLKDGYVR